ncbi:MAG: T9SS type A sorting domain-containing protein [Gelidibacter sp.]
MSFGQLVINEIDSDTPGSDTAEFLELKWTPNTSLNGYIVVFFNGSNDTSYATIDLTGKTTDANGFFILANESLATGNDIVLPAGGSGFIQNGPDAVAIYQAAAATFPDGSAPTMTNLVDALVYGTADPDDMELLTGLGETVQYDESANGASATESIQRKTDGTYETKVPTFRASNDTATCALSLTSTTATCDAFTAGTDTYTVSIDFSGGGTATYTVSSTAGIVGGDSPTSMATGTITVTGVNEGTDVTVTVVDGALCNLSSMVTSPSCDAMQSLPIYENFNYGTTAGDLTAVSGGVWENHSGSTPVAYATTSLSMPGYSSSGVGGSASITGSNSEDVKRSFTPRTSGLVYMSALVNLSSVGTGNYFMHLNATGADFVARVGAKDDGNGSVLFGIGTDSSTLTYGTTVFNLNTTYLIVASYNIDTDVSNLYVLTAPVASEPGTPEATNAGSGGTPLSSVSSVSLRQSSNIPTVIIDGLNVATSWGTVLSTNEFNSPNNFKIYPNPTSIGYVNISSNNTAAMSVTVFDVLGKQVLNQTVSNNRLNVATLKSGIYIMKISQDNATITKKLVIK